MKEMQFSIEIAAAKEKVWNTLWQDETFRQWASIIDPGTYMVGELRLSNEVQFISSENGYGVTSFVEELIVNEYLLLRHKADTQNTGKSDRADEWTGGTESYKLTEDNGTTIMDVAFDVPDEMEEYFNTAYPAALKKLKALAEG